MANHDGFSSSSQIMYPAVTTGEAAQQMVAAAPMPMGGAPAFGPQMSRGPEILNGSFNQTWLVNCLRRKWLMASLMGMVVALGVAALLLWLFPLSSSINALVHVQQESQDLMEDNKRFSPQELEIFQETQMSLIKSQFVLQSALNRPNIAQLNAVVKEEPDPITWLQEDLLIAFQGENLALRYDGEEDSEEMKKVVDAVIDAYKQEVLMKNNLRAAEMRQTLTKLHNDLRKELKDETEKYTDLAATLEGAESPIASSILNMLINEVRQIQSQIIENKKQLVEITVNRTVTEQHIKSTTAFEAAVAQEMDKDPMVANFKAEEFALIQQRRALASRSKQKNTAAIKRIDFAIQQLKQDMANYSSQAEREIRQALKIAPNDALAAVNTEFILYRNNITAEIARLEAELEDKITEIKQKGESSGELAMLESKIEQLGEIDRDMDYKLRHWEIQEQATDDLFRVLQPATALEKINTVQRYTLAAMGGIAAFCATCYGVALIEFRRRRLNGASDIDEGLGLRVLGVLPSVSSRKAMAPGSLLAAQVSESIDNVRATLMHDSTSRKRQVVLVTSPATMEGTTTVASHLALSLTRAGRRTLLIDGDVREPSLHKLFGMPMEDGLCELLRSDIDVADAVRPTSTEGLWLLTAGHCDMDAIHALATDQPQPIFEKLREEFDFIIIDGAPVLGLSDSISLGQHVDGAILTVLRDFSEIRKVYQAIDLMKSMGIRLLGSVVNGMPQKADRRVAQLHKSSASRPRKIAAAATSEASVNGSKPAKQREDQPVEVSEEVELDFDDLGLNES